MEADRLGDMNCTLPKKCFSLLFHLQILKQPEGVEGRLITLPKKVTPQFSKFANEKARRNIIWGVHNLNNQNPHISYSVWSAYR